VAVVADGLARVLPACSIDAGDGVLHPHASIGFALVHEGTQSAEQVFVEADRAMYAVKHAKAATPS
jgi:GGDEF domain-containing protein